ncbi:MAG: glycosyl hydrolase, partial [Gemmatimonadota bacterium]|nr:glycosyl hydrolase [Gemmatimonadota bacterium]
GETEERGIYRSTDGGENWEKILYVSPRAGASEISMDMTNPRILYAAFWDHLRRPWVVESGGEGSGIWKSTDGGDSWEQLTEGLPGLMGKIGVDVSRANPDRVFAVIEADAENEEGGLYRSDDAGKTWTQTSADRIIQTRSWYYMEVYADPNDENTVYVLNAPMMRSIDGGRTWENITVPHGDNHDMWINPNNSDVIVNANDGGANVSFNGGETWSSQRNQPTVQFYRVNADNQFPYHLYGGQQDNSSVGIASAALGGISWKDWYPSAGCESAYLAFDADDPHTVLGTCIQGGIDIWRRETGLIKSVQPYAMLGLGTRASNQRYRFDWNAPVVSSPHDGDTFYYGGNVVFKTTNYGQSWDVISPDLTRDEEDKQGLGGIPITNELAGGEIYNIIMYLIESPVQEGVIWVGTNDGLVQVTEDGGQTWSNVTPRGIDRAMINAIDASPHEAGTAYVAATNYKFNDFTPLIYKTENFGRNWELITDGIAEEDWVRVVREDTERHGLLYAGTETGIYISYDDGDSWQEWQLNLPVVPVTDLKVHHGDLLAATQGRGFWILDDLSAVRQMNESVHAQALHVFEPRAQVRVSWGGGFGFGPPTIGQNPPEGAQLFYHLGVEPDSLVTVEILHNGEVIRTYATDPEAAGNARYSTIEMPKLGLNRFSWDFRRETLPEVPGIMVMGSLAGRVVVPGDYQVRITSGANSSTVDLTVLPDPRWNATHADYVAQDAFVETLQNALTEMQEASNLVRGARDQVQAV